MDRNEKARVVAGRVAARIRKVAPPGLGHWGPTWGLVDVPSDVYMDALSAWEEADTPTSRSELEAAGEALIEAWAAAGRRWEAAGRPTHDEPEKVPV
jgi:hypothetical protein